MKVLALSIAAAAGLLAQNPPAQSPPASPAVTGVTGQSQPAPAPAAATTSAPAAAPSPVPTGDEILTGYIDLGYRWVTGVYGSDPTYRSIVDLNSGPKLLGTEFTLIDPKKRLFDRIAVRAYDWGDDPYSTLHVDMSKAKWYTLSADYRNIALYDNLPAFADPLIMTNGVTMNEQALNTRKRLGDYRLEIRPGSRFVPYLEYQHAADNGTGIATFVANDNEYPVASLVRDSTEDYRGGVRIELSRFHAKIEQGGTTFKDDQQLNQSGYTNDGNFFAPILGQTLDLTSLGEAYGVRGHSVYTDASFTANLVSWADLYGSFLYSEPQSSVNFLGLDTGNQVLLAQALFYTGEQDLISALSKQPHSSGNLGAEIRPFSRLRIVPSWFTDRMHTTGSAAGLDTLNTAGGAVSMASLLSSTLVNNTNEAQINLIYDLTRKITVRAGYRYEWGNASDGILPIAELVGFEYGKIRMNVATAGLSWHPLQNAWVNLDFEDGTSGSTYFRTDLYDYQKARIRGRHQIAKTFNVSASATVLNNTNPTPGVNYAFLAHQESASLDYTPSNGKFWSFEGGYTRSTLRSDINYLDPEFLIPEISLYRENSHTINALMNFNMPGWLGLKTRLTLGGSAFLSSGSNPTTFYQPTAKLAMDVHKHVTWVTEWRYYGFDEAFYVYQGFRANMVTTGVRLSR